MKKNSTAFVLIKSLTMSEKRYFKIFSERHTIGTHNKYVVLFDLLDKSEIENDNEFKRELNRRKINGNFISADKNYLYRLILRSLNDFHNARTKNLEVKEALLSIEILFHKGLYHECLKLISRAETIAAECENYSLMIDLLMWKKKCAGYSLGLAKAAEANNALDEQFKNLLQLKRVTDLYYESNFLQADHEKHPRTDIKKKFEKIIHHPYINEKRNTYSFTARIFILLIHANYYLVLNDQVNEYKQLQELIDMLNDSELYQSENPLDYISMYNRLLGIKKHIPEVDILKDIDRLRNFSQRVQIRKEVAVERVFLHTNTQLLDYYIIQNDFDKAVSMLNAREKEKKKLHIEIEPFHIIYFNYIHIVTLIFIGDFHKALRFINKTINDFHISHRPQIFIRIEMLNIIVHYELKNYDLVKSLVAQLINKNKRFEILRPVEIKIIQSLKKLASLDPFTFKAENNLFAELIEECEQEAKENPYLYGNAIKWLASRVKRKLVCECY